MLKKIYHDVDFCVVGGGLAGLCAAVAAARGGSVYEVLCRMALRAQRRYIIGET